MAQNEAPKYASRDIRRILAVSKRTSDGNEERAASSDTATASYVPTWMRRSKYLLKAALDSLEEGETQNLQRMSDA